jgi:proteasome lid subunit RPN8/RPN11
MPETEIVLDQPMLSEIHSHALSSYPEECCGLMIGKIDGGKKVVSSLRRMKNSFAPSERFHRYTIDPMDYLAVENEIEGHGQEIVGIYHSHPDAPAKPSPFDQSHAWPTLSYLVVKVSKSKTEDTTSWVLSEDRGEFLQERLTIESNNQD